MQDSAARALFGNLPRLKLVRSRGAVDQSGDGDGDGGRVTEAEAGPAASLLMWLRGGHVVRMGEGRGQLFWDWDWDWQLRGQEERVE